MNSRKRIMRRFRISEVSSVDRPAQPGALADIAKRDPAAAAQEALLRLHDLTGSRERPAVRALIEKAEADANRGVAGDLRATVAELRRRVDEEREVALEAVARATGASSAEAEAALEQTTAGRALSELDEMVTEIERALGRAPDSLETRKGTQQMDKQETAPGAEMIPQEMVDRIARRARAMMADNGADRDAAVEFALARTATADRGVLRRRVMEALSKGAPAGNGDLLDKSYYDDFGHVRDPAAALEALRREHAPAAPAAKSEGANDELEKRARLIQGEEDVDFHTAYARACDADPELAARAIAQG